MDDTDTTLTIEGIEYLVRFLNRTHDFYNHSKTNENDDKKSN